MPAETAEAGMAIAMMDLTSIIAEFQADMSKKEEQGQRRRRLMDGEGGFPVRFYGREHILSCGSPPGVRRYRFTGYPCHSCGSCSLQLTSATSAWLSRMRSAIAICDKGEIPLLEAVGDPGSCCQDKKPNIRILRCVTGRCMTRAGPAASKVSCTGCEGWGSPLSLRCLKCRQMEVQSAQTACRWQG